MNTMQQEFDAVVAHLYEQGRPAVDNGAGFTACWYRQPDSKNMCAVGCRIPDEVYRPEMDKADAEGNGTGVFNLVDRFRDVLPQEIVEYKAMFAALQGAHDAQSINDEFNYEWLEADLQRVANSFGLTFTKPEAK